MFLDILLIAGIGIAIWFGCSLVAVAVAWFLNQGYNAHKWWGAHSDADDAAVMFWIGPLSALAALMMLIEAASRALRNLQRKHGRSWNKQVLFKSKPPCPRSK